MKMPTKSRSQTILLDDLNQVFHIHNGRIRVKLRVHKDMLGLKYGEFAKTRTPRSLKQRKKGKKK